MMTNAKRVATASSSCTSTTTSTSFRCLSRRNRNGSIYDYQPACDVDSSARDRVFRRTEGLGKFASCRGDVDARGRTLSSTARFYGNCIRDAVCRASHYETRVYSRVLLLRRCDRDRAVARRFEAQSFCPDRTALDRRFHSGSLDFLLIRNRACPVHRRPRRERSHDHHGLALEGAAAAALVKSFRR